MCMALIINAMGSHAMTMMTVLVGVVDTLYPSSSRDAFHLQKMNSVQDSSSQHIDLQFHRNFLLLNQRFKTCTTSKIESTTLRHMEMEIQQILMTVCVDPTVIQSSVMVSNVTTDIAANQAAVANSLLRRMITAYLL